MKRLLFYIIALFAVSACAFDIDKPAASGTDGASLEGKPVTITFSVPDIRIVPSTKGVDSGDEGNIKDNPYLDPDKFFVVVCGSNQSIKYVRKAELQLDPNTHQPITTVVSIAQISDYPIPERLRDPAITTVTLYTFTVQLELSDKPRTVHFLGNIDESQLITGSYAYQILPYMMSYEWKQAYWQAVHLPSIKAQDDLALYPGTESFMPHPETSAKLQYVPLIRNFAEIKLTNEDDDFDLISYAVVGYPTRGTVAPFRFNHDPDHPEKGFSFTDEANYRLSGYEKSTFQELSALQYQGNLPAGVGFDDTIPSEDAFENPDDAALNPGRRVIANGDTGPGFYVFERGVPTENLPATFIILYGQVHGSAKPLYYKLDLMETDDSGVDAVARYYPLYRNFRYEILLKNVSSVGLDDPVAAANSSGAEDISKDISMRYLSDISNGQSRLVVEPYMSRTVTGPKEGEGEDAYYTLVARFYNNARSDVPNTDATAVQVMLMPMEDGSADILKLYNDAGYQVQSFYPSAGEGGVRTIHFNTVTAGSQAKTQKIRITGWNTEHHEKFPLYREVEITLQNTQPMRVHCETAELPQTIGAPQKISISIPEGLPASMFPLEFTIEAERMSLTPVPGTERGHNLPVVSATSISDNPEYAGKKTFQFIRTLTLDEYRSLTPEAGWCTFDCYFKSNRKDSATTVWVYNEFFEKGHDIFNNKTNSFTDLAFTSYIRRQTDAEIPVHFEVSGDDIPEITVSAVGMTIGGQTTYTFTPAQSSVNLTFTSTVADGDVSLTLSAAGYETSSIRSHYFTIMGFLDGIVLPDNKQSNVVFGYVNNAINKVNAVPFGFRDDGTVPDGLAIRNLNNENSFTSLSYPATFYRALTGAEANYHEIDFKTKTSASEQGAKGFRLTANGYVEEYVRFGRYNGDIGNYQNSYIDVNNVLKPSNNQTYNSTYNFGPGKNSYFNFTPTSGSDRDRLIVKVSFGTMPVLAASSGGLWLNLSGTEPASFTMTVESTNANPLYYVEITFSDGNVPDSMTGVSSEGDTERVWKYPGTGEQRYIWNLAKKVDSNVTHTITFNTSRNINIKKILIKSTTITDLNSYIEPAGE